MNILCRFLTAADAPAFRALRLRSLRDHPDAYASTPQEWGEAIETYVERIEALPVVGAFQDGRMVGTAILGVTARDMTKTRHKCEVWSVYTSPEARNSGVAKAMLRLIGDEARRRGYEALMLSVSSHNTPARRLYESIGFIRYGTEPRHLKLPDGRYIDEDLMQLEL
jgi:ribosomal protein S18 acetylase RimI-like enzyme